MRWLTVIGLAATMSARGAIVSSFSCSAYESGFDSVNIQQTMPCVAQTPGGARATVRYIPTNALSGYGEVSFVPAPSAPFTSYFPRSGANGGFTYGLTDTLIFFGAHQLRWSLFFDKQWAYSATAIASLYITGVGFTNQINTASWRFFVTPADGPIALSFQAGGEGYGDSFQFGSSGASLRVSTSIAGLNAAGDSTPVTYASRNGYVYAVVGGTQIAWDDSFLPAILPDPNAVPEPGSILLVLSGLLLAGGSLSRVAQCRARQSAA